MPSLLVGALRVVSCLDSVLDEFRGEGDEGELHGWIFGCDLCQRACPHNRRAPIASNKAFRPVPELERMNAEQWLALNRAQFDRLFSQTPLARCGLQKLQDRIRKLGKE